MPQNGTGRATGVLAIIVGIGFLVAFSALDTSAIFKIVPLLAGVGFIIVGISMMRGD